MQCTETTLTTRLIDEIVNVIRMTADAKIRPCPTICIVDEEGSIMFLSRGVIQAGDTIVQAMDTGVIASLLAKCAQITGADGQWPALRGNMSAMITSLIASLLAEDANTALHSMSFDSMFYDYGAGLVLRDLSGVVIGSMGVVAEDIESSRRYAEVGRAAFYSRLALDRRCQA